jgi:phage shock protein C
VPRKLTRDTKHAAVAGVAAGFARYLDVDPVLARLAFVLLAFVNGLGLLVYLAGWVLMPSEQAVAAGASGAAAQDGSAEATAPGFESLRDASSQLAAEVRKATTEPASAQLAIGSVLVVVGTLLLADNLGLLRWPYWMRFETLWPLALVALGLGLVAKSRRTLSS